MKLFRNTPQSFVEYSQAGNFSRLDREKSVLRGVKILGLISLNSRRYAPSALRKARKLYEKAKVNVNHPQNSPNSPRDYRDRIGNIRNVQFRENEGLFADFYFNPCHPLAEQMMWDAEHAPENVGFSHNILGRTSTLKDGTLVVDEITSVRSVDLVADPATTHGLFESEISSMEKAADEQSKKSESLFRETESYEGCSSNSSGLEQEISMESDLSQNSQKYEMMDCEVLKENGESIDLKMKSKEFTNQSEDRIVSDAREPFPEPENVTPLIEALQKDFGELQEQLEKLKKQFCEFLHVSQMVSFPVSRIPNSRLREENLSIEEFVNYLRR
ncbi:MAG: hypothetical protein E7028_05455 [Planctomycetaceae bacterium]|nr:hypothetical protein [Planctomycetaceae bacterium]